MRAEWDGQGTEPEDWQQLLMWLLEKYERISGEVFGFTELKVLIDRIKEPLTVYFDSRYRMELVEFPSDEGLREYPELYEQLFHVRDAYDGFLEALSRSRRNKRFDMMRLLRSQSCLFISHRQCDHKLAKRVACIAQEHSYEYWLDIENPELAAINGAQGLIPATVRSILIAATIEIGLLNCTHVIALLSQNAKGSQWIPYEFGRAKNWRSTRLRHLWSPTAATWIQNTVRPPEYAYLATVLRTERGLRNWLKTPRIPMECEPVTRKDSLDQQ